MQCIQVYVRAFIVGCLGVCMSFVARLFRWDRGRQKTGYHKMLLCGARWPIKFDTYLLRFPEGNEIKPHTDKVASGQHYRLNIVIKNADVGGDFICSNTLFESAHIKFFRPDISEHQVSKILKGNRYLLSIGWVKNT